MIKEKTSISDILDVLIKKAKEKDIIDLRMARDIVNNTMQDDYTKKRAIEMIKKIGYSDYAYYLEMLDLDYYEIMLSDDYKKKLFSI